MLLLEICLNVALLFLVPIAAVPLNSKPLNPEAVPYVPLALPDLEVSKRTLATEGEFRGSTGLQRRELDSRRALILLDHALPSLESTGNLKTTTDHRIDCYPRGAPLPYAVAEDCEFIINHLILGMKDPFRVQTWGFSDSVDINLSLPKYHWDFQACDIRVENLHKRHIDSFRPVDVAVVAQRIVQKCIVDTKERLGGDAGIGHLPVPATFYITVSGSSNTGDMSLGNNTVISLPSNRRHIFESRTSPNLPEKNAISNNATEGLEAGETYPVHCFNPTRSPSIQPAIASDCSFIINEIILRLPEPMIVRSFGFTDAEDINVSEPENNHWVYGRCVVFLRNINKTSRDLFRFVDVAYAAQRILNECVEGTKYAPGGTTDIGTIEDNFYVCVGGLSHRHAGNGTTLVLASDTVVSRLSDPMPAPTSAHSYISTVSVDLDKRSNDIPEVLQATDGFAPDVRCFQPGMTGARNVDVQDCYDAARVLFKDSNLLLPQLFTTEPTGGIRMPFMQRNQSCYLMMDSGTGLSTSDSIPLLKMVYWALEITLKCVSGRAQGLGGVSTLNEEKSIFVSVTGLDPRSERNGPASLWDENTSLQIVDLGQS